MTTPKYKHFKFEDRYVIQEFLRLNYSFTAIANRLKKKIDVLSLKKFLSTVSLRWEPTSVNLTAPSQTNLLTSAMAALTKHPANKTNTYTRLLSLRTNTKRL